MLIDKVILHDFGVFGGYTTINVTPPKKNKPIILFGGLNGTGKTTLLDAMKLSLYGPIAKCSNRSGLAYDEFLRRCINKNSQWNEALVGLDFTHTTVGVQDKYSLRRSWKEINGKVIENFEAFKNDIPLASPDKNWLQQVDDIMPANIAHLFFFDGEQAEDYALPDNSSQLVETAILGLLGLDTIDRLEKDLKTLEKKIKVANASQSEHGKIKNIEDKLKKINAKHESLANELIQIENQLETTNSAFDIVNKEYQTLGGELYERRNEIEKDLAEKKERMNTIKASLREHAENTLPLMMTKSMIGELLKRDNAEQEILSAKNTLSAIEQYNEKLIKHLEAEKIDKHVTKIIKQFNKDETAKNNSLASKEVLNPLDEATRLAAGQLLRDSFPKEKKIVSTLLLELMDVEIDYSNAQLEYASIPEESDVTEIRTSREQLQQTLTTQAKRQESIQKDIDAVERERERTERVLQSLITSECSTILEEKDNARVTQYSAKARTTLMSFRKEVINQHISQIEQLVLESYQVLLRKKSLVGRIKIDPNNFGLTIYGLNGHAIPPERLSAGERQLMAVSLLWGMAKASGRPLPTAIDTPLGRLDAKHRELLVKNYFPNASHQVMLFSTDKELYGENLKCIKPCIGKSFRLEHDDGSSTTKIKEGYFPS